MTNITVLRQYCVTNTGRRPTWPCETPRMGQLHAPRFDADLRGSRENLEEYR